MEHISPLGGDGELPSISNRLAFLGIDDHQRHVLSEIKSSPIHDILNDSLKIFYERIRETPELSEFFKTDEVVEKASQRQKEHWVQLFSGEFDEHYVRNVTKIGETHARIGLDPQWYIAGYAVILERIIQDVISNSIVRGTKPQKVSPQQMAHLGELIGVVVKAACLDMDMAISTYLNRLKQEREKAAKENDALIVISEAIDRMAEGDMTVTLNPSVIERSPVLANSFKRLKERVQDMAEEIKGASSLVGTSSEKISDGVAKAEERAQDQVSAISEITELTRVLKNSISGVAKQTEAAEDAVRSCLKATMEGNANVTKAQSSMEQIETIWKVIHDLVGAIDGIATQTNLLALNASVEAARVGDEGGGFAVIAGEIRTLANTTKNTAEQISEKTRLSKDLVLAASISVSSTAELLAKIKDGVSLVEVAVTNINSEMNKQTSSAESTHHEAIKLQKTTQESVQLAGLMRKSSRDLMGRSQAMQILLKEFGFA
ncbi:methyl-accepting chemotaxis protein [Acetobacter pasteurianus NBRC 3280]|uniref:Methyl-accepting chemotaxis protein n=1 Tax=Acetobacter pasteurianus NBRC 3278 TaxID=1226660 RepID=A0A401X6V8_ACEPA|nr:protoglobin domain-containing protein [Acetobacter pasteurianus]GCD59990.1 methyl-accepting chemotaxis protein [Acetobacter pasteurianus NBRC 3277]GCD63621.1 methyl-accepting chemotaxis protein [Acetobacter pasteurianus NBRC 3278]GCD70042.1 methyl-accepting chemotaxis protein [Acetobacter pasteurianus NBRC 3280]